MKFQCRQTKAFKCAATSLNARPCLRITAAKRHCSDRHTLDRTRGIAGWLRRDRMSAGVCLSLLCTSQCAPLISNSLMQCSTISSTSSLPRSHPCTWWGSTAWRANMCVKRCCPARSPRPRHSCNTPAVICSCKLTLVRRPCQCQCQFQCHPANSGTSRIARTLRGKLYCRV